MMRPDDGTINHIGGDRAPGEFRQRLKHRIEYAGRDPSSVSPENAVPFSVFIRQMTPLRARPRDPHHTFEVAPVILRWATTTTAFWRQ